MLSSNQKTDTSDKEASQMYSREEFDKDIQKLRDLIKKCEELEVNNNNYYNSIYHENPINQSRFYKND